MESTNRMEEYLDTTKGVSTDIIKDRIFGLEENIGNLEKEIMAKVSQNEDASALMEEAKEESLKCDMYKYILAKREAQKASDNWNDFEEKFIANSEQESIFNTMRKSQKKFESAGEALDDEAEKLEKDAAELKYKLAYNCLKLFDYKTIIEGTTVVTDDLQSTIELDYIKKLAASLEYSILKDRIKLASINKRLCLMRNFYGRENLEKNEQRIFAILKNKIEENANNPNA